MIAEMGGKNAIIVDDDADLDEAVTGVAAVRLRLPGAEVLGLLAGHRGRRRLRRVPRAAGRGDGEPQGRPRRDPELPCRPGDRRRGAAIESSRHRIEGARRRRKLASRRTCATSRRRVLRRAARSSPDVPPESLRSPRKRSSARCWSVMRAKDLDEALDDRQRHALRPDRRRLLAQPAQHRTRASASSASATSTSTARSPARWSTASRSAGSSCRGIGSKAGGPDYLLQFCCPRTITENTMRRGFAPWTRGTESGLGAG